MRKLAYIMMSLIVLACSQDKGNYDYVDQASKT